MIFFFGQPDTTLGHLRKRNLNGRKTSTRLASSVRHVTPGKMTMGCIRKNKQRKLRQEASFLLLPQFLPQGSCLNFLPLLPFLVINYKQK